MEDVIGETAGEVWNFLNAEGPKSLAAITRNIRTPDTTIYMAIGWLARENKLLFTRTNRGVIIALRPEESQS